MVPEESRSGCKRRVGVEKPRVGGFLSLLGTWCDTGFVDSLATKASFSYRASYSRTMSSSGTCIKYSELTKPTTKLGH